MSGIEITHEGIVREVGDDHVFVSFISQPACISCSIKNNCSLSETEIKHLKVPVSGKIFHTGEKVLITLGQSHGFKAVLLGYFLPFLIVFICLIVSLTITSNELIAGLISISSLIPYYLLLWILRGMINNSFKFRLMKV